MEREYESSLSNVNKIKSAIDKTNKKTCMTRLSFMKVYESKKVKLEDSHLNEQLKIART